MKSFRYCCGDMACFTRHTHYPNLVIQGSRKVRKSDRAGKNVVGIIYTLPPDLPKSGGRWQPLPPTLPHGSYGPEYVCSTYIRAFCLRHFRFIFCVHLKLSPGDRALPGLSPVWCVCRVFKEKKPIITLMDVKKILEYSSENMGVVGFFIYK